MLNIKHNHNQEVVILNPSVKFITRTAILLAIALAVQFMRLPQFITGPVVNAVLILAVAYVGVSGGIIIGLLTPGVAFLFGILPGPLAPMIPVIMAANIVLVLFFAWLRRYQDYVGVIIAAVAKLLTFYLAINYILVYLGIKLPAALLSAFTLPQLYTALIGGLVAAFIIRQYPELFRKLS
jgi:hypothetical protein